MHHVIFKVGSYGMLFHAVLTPTELNALSNVLMRAVAVRDKYDGTFELRANTDDSRPTITIVRDCVIVAPPAPATTTEE